jgi:hypothetical protein
VIGLFVVLMIAGWVGLISSWQQGVGWGLLGSVAYLAWAVLWGLAFRGVAERDPDFPEDAVSTGSRVVWSFGLGVPVLYANLLAWHLPVLAVVVNLASISAAVVLVRASRRRAAERQRAEGAAEVAALQAEIDAEEAEQARLNTARPPAPRRWAPPGYQNRDAAYWQHGQGFRVGR